MKPTGHRPNPVRSPFAGAPPGRAAERVEAKVVPRVPEELVLCGWQAVSAAFARRGDAVKRLFFDETTAPRTGAWTAAMARDRRIYRMVPRAELEKISGTVHHGGVVAVVDQEPPRVPSDAEVAEWGRAAVPLVLLDRVANPHNVGFLARTAAFFGYPHLLLSGGSSVVMTEAAWRVAEGGLEWVTCWDIPAAAEFCRRHGRTFLVVGTLPGKGAEPLSSLDLRRLRRPPVLVFGNEEQGLSPDVAAVCERRLAIEGCGRVESLNVSAAAAVVLHTFAPLLKLAG